MHCARGSVLPTPTKPTGEHVRAFVSYAHSDVAERTVHAIADALRHGGISVWNPAEDIYVGQDLKSSLDYALHEADLFVVLVSENYMRSVWCRAEFDLLLAENEKTGKPVIPVLLGGVDGPGLLGGFQAIDGRARDPREIADQIADAARRATERTETVAAAS